MDLDAILLREPVNKVARRVTFQHGVASTYTPLSRDELVYLMTRLLRKHRLLKHVLRIKTKAQHVNTRYKANQGIWQYRGHKEPRALNEYMRCGEAIQILNTELAGRRKARQFAAQAETEYKALMAAHRSLA